MRDHEAYKEAHNAVVDWLKEKRSTIQCSISSHGTKEQVLEKLNKLSTLERDLSEGDKLIAETKALSVAVIESTGGEGVDKIEHDLGQAESELQEVKNSVSDAVDLLMRCVSSWDNFTTVLNALKAWESASLAKVSVGCGVQSGPTQVIIVIRTAALGG